MARASRDARLETRTSRLKLARGKRFFAPVTDNLSLCYRRTADGYGTWAARIRDAVSGRESLAKLGAADDHADADGQAILTYRQAQEKCREQFKAIATNGKPVTVSDAATRYLTWYREHRKAFRETEATINAHILPVFGERLVSDLRTPEIRAWLERIGTKAARKRTAIGRKQQFRDKPASEDAKRARKSTANRVLTVLKAILNRAFEDEFVSDNSPWRRVKPFENADEPIVRFLTEDESKRLINACRSDLRQMVKAALLTGARYSELAGLTVANVNIGTGSVFIQPSKSGRGRHVPLSPAGLDFFKSATAGKIGSDLVFVKADGSQWAKNHHVRLLADACRIAKITPAIGFHEARHTYASLLAQAGADLLTISKLLGHADTRITSRHYAHLCDRTLANAVNTLLPSFGHQNEAKVVGIR